MIHFLRSSLLCLGFVICCIFSAHAQDPQVWETTIDLGKHPTWNLTSIESKTFKDKFWLSAMVEIGNAGYPIWIRIQGLDPKSCGSSLGNTISDHVFDTFDQEIFAYRKKQAKVPTDDTFFNALKQKVIESCAGQDFSIWSNFTFLSPNGKQ